MKSSQCKHLPAIVWKLSAPSEPLRLLFFFFLLLDLLLMLQIISHCQSLHTGCPLGHCFGNAQQMQAATSTLLKVGLLMGLTLCQTCSERMQSCSALSPWPGMDSLSNEGSNEGIETALSHLTNSAQGCFGCSCVPPSSKTIGKNQQRNISQGTRQLAHSRIEATIPASTMRQKEASDGSCTGWLPPVHSLCMQEPMKHILSTRHHVLLADAGV